MQLIEFQENTIENSFQAILQKVDVMLNGKRPWDLQIHNPHLFKRLLKDGTLGFGESYMDGWWDCHQLDECVARLMSIDVDQKLNHGFFWHDLRTYLFNLQSQYRAWIVGEEHYDLSIHLFQRMLDRRLTYTCGYWQNAQTLDEAQEHKLDLVCRKIRLKPGDTVLDIGCGWGSFVEFAAANYGANVVGVTISQEQARYATRRCRHLPVDIRLGDYRTISGRYDHIVSLGMFEHVGLKNYRPFMELARDSLNDNGLFLLHTIGGNSSVRRTDLWIDKYIFPNGMLPSIAQIGSAIENLFVMEDWHNFGPDYDKTLMAWYANFIRHWPELESQYDQRFYRMWCYYLLSCAGAFRSRKNQLWQIVLSPNGVPGGYESVR